MWPRTGSVMSAILRQKRFPSNLGNIRYRTLGVDALTGIYPPIYYTFERDLFTSVKDINSLIKL
jgi:hypothetical protein